RNLGTRTPRRDARTGRPQIAAWVSLVLIGFFANRSRFVRNALNSRDGLIGALNRQLWACDVERTRLHVGADVVRECGHVGDLRDPGLDVTADRFSTQADLNGPMRQRCKVKIAFGVPLNAHRRSVLKPLPAFIVQTMRPFARTGML